LKDED
jgi:hypothetical protein